MTDIYEAVTLERARQNKQWGGDDHDDSHSTLEWIYYITKQLVKAGDAAEKWDFIEVRRKFVQVAALAIAAAEAAERRNKVERE